MASSTHPSTPSGTRGWLTLFVLMGTLFSPGIATADEVLSGDILVDWTSPHEYAPQRHAYLLSLNRIPSAEELGGLEILVSIEAANSTVRGNWNFTWGDGLEAANTTAYRVRLPIMPMFGDIVTIDATLDETPLVSRTVVVTAWNQPLDDHEVTLSTDWRLQQEGGEGTYILDFSGRGWQSREDGVLESHELGLGNLTLDENRSGQRTILELQLSKVWRNQTSTGLAIDSEVFEMRGNGSLVLIEDQADVVSRVEVDVVDSFIIRSVERGVVSEHLRLEGRGDLNISGGNDGEYTEITGDISLLFLELMDDGGMRVLDHVELEADADMFWTDGESEMYLDVSEYRTLEHWEGENRTNQLERIRATGTMGFASQNEEGGDVVINATVHDFFSETTDGNTTGDMLWVDGTISGSTSGTFGMVKDIIETGEYGNASGVIFPVNIIHSEVWYNITAGGGMGEGIDLGAYNNETWDWQVLPVDWDNRTIRFKWEERGSNPSSGEEWPVDSPIVVEPEHPETESGLGDVNFSREAGLAPEVMREGDSIELVANEQLHLSVTATGYSNRVKDGHDFFVTEWEGEYLQGGDASGCLVSQGPLSGLIIEVIRNTTLDAGDSVVNLIETQTLERVLSPSIVTAEENHEPTIVYAGVREGSLLNEGGSVSHIEVEVEDLDWNVISVSADLSTLGLGIVSLNDVGEKGDYSIHDDVWTTEITYNGIENGTHAIPIIVTDMFDATAEASLELQLLDLPPRLLSATTDLGLYSPLRGESFGMEVEAEDAAGVGAVSIDFRASGGGLIHLEQNGMTWKGEVVIPDEVTPGPYTILILLVDEHGAKSLVDGPTINIGNSGPVLGEPTLFPETVIIPNDSVGAVHLLTVEGDDSDGISMMHARIGALALPGQSDQWLEMHDDGSGGDVTAGDGIWSLTFTARPGLPSGSVVIKIRGTDGEGAVSVRDFVVTIETAKANPANDGSESITEVLSRPLVIIGMLGVLLVLAGAGLMLFLQKADFKGRFGED